MKFVIRQLQEKCREQNRNIYMAFVDLSIAFDTVNRDMLWELLSKYGCPAKFISILRQFHEGMEAQVVMGADKSASFPVTMGVKQGCVIAPVLFNFYIMSVTLMLQSSVSENANISIRYRTDRSIFNLEKLQARTKCSTISLLELQYADDCAFVTHTEEAMQEVLT